MQTPTPSLARKLGFFALVIYGIGDILGAGIYALVGKVIGAAGPAAWLSFLLSSLLALLTGFSYAELCARFPVSAGAAAYIGRAFQNPRLSTFLGIVVLGTGVISAATVTVAFGAYLGKLFPLPLPLAYLGFLAIFSFLSFWGIQESSRLNMLLTAVEATGLVLVLWAAAQAYQPGNFEAYLADFRQHFDFSSIFLGITVGFYAFIGFEDLANLAEETKEPRRDLPRAILIAIALTTFLYIAVCLALLWNIPREAIG
ncbi:MAG: APC family permease, partial [Candidatus Binatia bacterium]